MRKKKLTENFRFLPSSRACLCSSSTNNTLNRYLAPCTSTTQTHCLLQNVDEPLVWPRAPLNPNLQCPQRHGGGGPRLPPSEKEQPSAPRWSQTTACQRFLRFSTRQFIRNESVWQANFWLRKTGGKKNTQKKEWKKNTSGNLQWASFIQHKMWQNNPPPQPFFFFCNCFFLSIPFPVPSKRKQCTS